MTYFSLPSGGAILLYQGVSLSVSVSHCSYALFDSLDLLTINFSALDQSFGKANEKLFFFGTDHIRTWPPQWSLT